MLEHLEHEKLHRLEDFINLANKGKAVRLEVTLRKRVLTPKDSSQEPYRLSVDRDIYFLMGDYDFDDAGEAATVSKVYILGSVDESPAETQERRQAANERLKMDYRRLKYAGIGFEEKYF